MREFSSVLGTPLAIAVSAERPAVGPVTHQAESATTDKRRLCDFFGPTRLHRLSSPGRTQHLGVFQTKPVRDNAPPACLNLRTSSTVHLIFIYP
jgi:hypothetical protein